MRCCRVCLVYVIVMVMNMNSLLIRCYYYITITVIVVDFISSSSCFIVVIVVTIFLFRCHVVVTTSIRNNFIDVIMMSNTLLRICLEMCTPVRCEAMKSCRTHATIWLGRWMPPSGTAAALRRTLLMALS